MARLFDDAASESLSILQAVVTGEPFAITAWVYPDSESTDMYVINIADKDVDDHYHGINLDTSGGSADDVRAITRDPAGTVSARSSIPWTVNTWNHVTGVWATTSDRRALLAGGNKGTNATNRTAAGLDKTAIGVSADVTPVDYMSGRIAEVGVWNLTNWPGATASDKADEFERVAVPALALGYSPLFFQLGLVAYWALIQDEDQDRVGGYDMTAFNTPSIAAHPPSIYPAPQSIIVPEIVAAGANVPQKAHYYRRRR